jgi:hypothetical protein
LFLTPFGDHAITTAILNVALCDFQSKADRVALLPTRSFDREAMFAIFTKIALEVARNFSAKLNGKARRFAIAFGA